MSYQPIESYGTVGNLHTIASEEAWHHRKNIHPEACPKGVIDGLKKLSNTPDVFVFIKGGKANGKY